MPFTAALGVARFEYRSLESINFQFRMLDATRMLARFKSAEADRTILPPFLSMAVMMSIGARTL